MLFCRTALNTRMTMSASVSDVRLNTRARSPSLDKAVRGCLNSNLIRSAVLLRIASSIDSNGRSFVFLRAGGVVVVVVCVPVSDDICDSYFGAFGQMKPKLLFML